MRPFSWASTTVAERKLTKPELGHQKKAGDARVQEGPEGVHAWTTAAEYERGRRGEG